MKTIVVKWIEEDSIYGQAMQVIESDHERFNKGTRFDFGFFSVATEEGYTIISLPLATPIEEKCDHGERLTDYCEPCGRTHSA